MTLLQKMRDKSMVEDPASRLRGRASADVMQALTSDPNYRSTQLSDLPSDMNKALQGQQQQATAAGKGYTKHDANQRIGYCSWPSG